MLILAISKWQIPQCCCQLLLLLHPMWTATVADVGGAVTVVVGVVSAFQRQHGKAFVLTGSIVLHNLLEVTHRAFQGFCVTNLSVFPLLILLFLMQFPIFQRRSTTNVQSLHVAAHSIQFLP